MTRAALLVALALMLGAPAAAQQAGGNAALVQQPFGQLPPPPPPPPPQLTPEQKQALDREHHRLPRWLYRGLIAATVDIDAALEIDTPVTGYGNEALWDVPPIERRVPAVVAVQRDPR